MRQLVRTDHVLEIKIRNEIWRPPDAGFLLPARTLAYQGHIIEALDEAAKLYLQNYGNMHGILFRVRTETQTLSSLAPFDSIDG